MQRVDGGFTLIEVVVALALAGMLLLGARWILAAAGGGAEQVSAETARVDRVANAERALRDLVLATEARFAEGPRFRGNAHAARWGTWCDVPAGWQERCEVTLAVLPTGGRNILTVALPNGGMIPVREGFTEGRLLYLRSAAAGGMWSETWDSGVDIPVAVGVVLDDDTLILRIGGRN